MKIYLSGDVEANVINNETGGVDVTIIFPPKTYYSDEEYLRDKYDKIYGALIELKKEVPELRGVFNHGRKLVHSHVLSADKKDDGKKVSKKTNKKSPVKIKIEEPNGNQMYILGDATVEYFGKDPNIVWANVELKVAKGAVRAFNTGGKRYVAGFNRDGKFIGYLLSTDMKTQYIPPGTVAGMMADRPTRDALENAARQTGTDIEDLETIAMIESTGMRTIGKGGLLQVKQLALDQIAPQVSEDTVSTDVDASAFYGAEYLNYVTGQIKTDKNPSLTDRYLAYQLGKHGFEDLIDTKDKPPKTIITKDQYDNLPGNKKAPTYALETMTQKDFYEYWEKRIKDKQDEVTEYNNKKQ